MSDIFQEVDEDLRRENYAKLWARYGKYVMVLAALLVVAVLGVDQWRAYRLHQREAEGGRFADALELVHQGKDKDAADAFAAIGRQGDSGHAMLGRLEASAAKARAGDVEGAIAGFDALAGDASVDPVYRGVATLLAAQYGLKSGDPQAIIAKLAPLTSADNPWHPTAVELTALAQLKAGDKVAARASYQRLSDDLNAPAGLRARAAEMVAALAE